MNRINWILACFLALLASIVFYFSGVQHYETSDDGLIRLLKEARFDKKLQEDVKSEQSRRCLIPAWMEGRK
jgi:hypothetical protein